MTDARTQITQFHDDLQANLAKLMAPYRSVPMPAPYGDGGVAASEADVQAAENEPGLGDGSADPVREAEQSPGLAPTPAPPAPFPGPVYGASGVRPSPSDAAVTAMNAALHATRAALVQNVTLIDQSLAAADTAVRQAMAAMALQPGGGAWRG